MSKRKIAISPQDIRQQNEQTSTLYLLEQGMMNKGKSLRRLADIQAMLSDIFQDTWFRQQISIVTGYEVHSGRGYRGMGTGWRDENGICHIALPVPYRYELFVLHELAHGLEPTAKHGGGFVATYLELIRRYLGQHAWCELRDGCQTLGVRYRRSRTQQGDNYGMEMFECPLLTGSMHNSHRW